MKLHKMRMQKTEIFMAKFRRNDNFGRELNNFEGSLER